LPSGAATHIQYIKKVKTGQKRDAQRSKFMPKEQLLREFAEAYEHIIATATEAAQRGVTATADGWGPRETIAHLTGWEVMASVRVPAIVGGMAPIEFADPAQNNVMNDAINGAFVALIGDQPLAAACALLRQTYQRNATYLMTLNDTFFQPGEYVYERTKSVIEHCEEHSETLSPTWPASGA
jgi:hypothetical protein